MSFDQAAAAKMIRQWLKAEGVVGRVTSKSYSGGSNVNVHLVDQKPEVFEKVRTYANQFEYGSFDGMQDLYNFDNVRNDIPQAKYVFVNNEISDELRAKIWKFARGRYNCLVALPADVAEVYNIWVPELNNWAGSIVNRLFGENQYWETLA